MTKTMKWMLGIVGVIVLAYSTLLFAQSLTSGWTLATASSASACPIATTFGLCGVTTSPATLDISLNGGPYVQLYPSTGTAGVASFNNRTGAVVPVSGDYDFSQLTGQTTGAQLPATFTCGVAYTNFTGNGSGGGAFTATITGCK